MCSTLVDIVDTLTPDDRANSVRYIQRSSMWYLHLYNFISNGGIYFALSFVRNTVAVADTLYALSHSAHSVILNQPGSV